MWNTTNWLFVALNPPLEPYCIEILRPLANISRIDGIDRHVRVPG
jgi:hypothetical protein